MDRATKYQSAMTISNGSFTRPATNQSDPGGVKSLMPSVLDRFRAMVKEREEKIGGFVGEDVLPLNRDEIVRIYEILLSSLSFNSKPIITDLTIIAGEQKEHAEGIADVICARIIEVPVDQKLPSLYLLDSIVKNIGKEYSKYFSVHLPEVFCEAYAQVHPSMHSAMRHLFGTWSSVFPLSVLRMIEAQLQFSPPIHGQSSGTSSLRASESPRPAHGIHVNPKCMEARHQFGNSILDSAEDEGVSSIARAGHKIYQLDPIKKAIPLAARIGHGRSLSPSLEEFRSVGSPRNFPVRASPSHTGMNYGLNRKADTERTSSAYGHTRIIDPRALINAYGVDEREKTLMRKQITPEQLETNGINQTVVGRTWQNTEEEEFDWDNMNPALANRKQQLNEISPLHPTGSSKGRHVFSTSYAPPMVTDHVANWSRDRVSSFPGSSGIGDISHINLVHGLTSCVGVLPNILGNNDLTSHIPSSFDRESLILPHQQSQIHLNARRGASFSESRRLLNEHPGIGNLPNIDMEFVGASNAVSILDEFRPANAAAFPKPWDPLNVPSSHNLPPISAAQMQIRGPFGTKNTSNIDQALIEHLSNSRNMSQVNFPQIPSQRPNLYPQNHAQASFVQHNLLMSQDVKQNIPMPITYGYQTRGHVPQFSTMSSNPVPGVQLPLLNISAPNRPFHLPGPVFPSPAQGRYPGTNQLLMIGQNMGQVASNPQSGGALTGLISSLVNQGLISIAKKDSLGTEFDPESLKVRHESAITALYADLPRQCTTCGLRFKTQEEHSKHMDWHVNKNRTLKNRKTKPSPKWFVSVNMWLHSAEAVGTEVVSGLIPDNHNNMQKEEDEEEMAVPADEDQKSCALCGEPFDDFYSDEMEEWMYKGAVYMYAPAELTVGMDRSQLGPIVHAKCRSDSHGFASEELTKHEEESSEDGRKMKKLRS